MSERFMGGIVNSHPLYDSSDLWNADATKDKSKKRATKTGNKTLTKLSKWIANVGATLTSQGRSATRAAHEVLGQATLPEPEQPVIVYKNPE